MKTEVYRVLYVYVGDEPKPLILIDALCASLNTHMTGERRLMTSAEQLQDALDEKLIPAEFVGAVERILQAARLKNCTGDINIYC